MIGNFHSAPILLIVFNRPQKTRALVDRLMEWSGLDILVAADGPRNAAERGKCDAVRAIIAELAARHRVQTRFSDVNLGCGANVAGAITWAFAQRETLIIIEDDIDITSEFLSFCNDGLDRYRDHSEIFCISSGPLVNLNSSYSTLFLTRFPNIWGWASWRDRWAGYSLTLDGHSTKAIWRVLSDTFPSVTTRLYFLILLQLMRTRRVDSWDFQLYFLAWAKSAFALIPSHNLAQNVGFDEEGTHMRRVPANVGVVTATRMALDLAQPIALSNTYDQMIARDVWRISLYRVLRFVIKYLITRPARYSMLGGQTS
ncbi:hypothetical protein [Sphingomonas sp.]|uniref:hypothetical protein n=1 Tax=Sphingomonas sp. TaxID=28214 RepID=UPI003CC626AB